MADAWTVPINTAGFNDLNDTIAKGHDLSWIGNLPDAFWKGQDQKYTQDQRTAFQDGLPKDSNGNIDWSAVTEKLAKVGGTSQLSNILPLQKFDLARSMLQGDNSQPSTAQFPPSASRPSGTVQPQQQSQAQPQSDADIPTARPSPPGQNLTGSGSTITGVDYGPVQTNGPNPVQTVSYTPSNPQGDQAAPQQPTAPPQTFAQRFAPATQGGAPQAQPQSTQPPPTVAGPQGNINEATASRYEAIAAQAFKKSQAAALVDPAMSAAYKAQAESAAKQAEIIRGALAKNAETTPDMKDSAASNVSNPLDYGAMKAERTKQVENLGKLADAGIDAKGKIGQLNTVQQLGEKVGYGVVPKMQSFLGQYGIDTKGLSDIQAYERSIDFMAPQLRPVGSGRLMQQELTAFKSALGGLMTTPEGRRISVDNLKLINNYSAQVGEIAADTSLSPSQRYQKIYSLDPPHLTTQLPKGAGQPQGGGQQTWTGPSGKTYNVVNGALVPQ